MRIVVTSMIQICNSCNVVKIKFPYAILPTQDNDMIHCPSCLSIPHEKDTLGNLLWDTKDPGRVHANHLCFWSQMKFSLQLHQVKCEQYNRNSNLSHWKLSSRTMDNSAK
jgi:hypothetical protein